MKKRTLLFFMVMMTMGLCFLSCDDENDDGNFSKTTYEFSVSEEFATINAPAEGETYTILVTSTKTAKAGTSNVTYQILSSPEWAEVSLEQTALVVKIGQNSSTESRPEAKIHLQQDESEKLLDITLNQSGYANSLSLLETYQVARCKVLTIEPKIEGFDSNPIYEWTMTKPNEKNAEVISKERNLSLIELQAGEYLVSLTVTDDSAIRQTAQTKVTVVQEEKAYSPFIAKVLNYQPAVLDTRVPFAPIDDAMVALKKVEDKLIGKDFSEFNQNSAPLGSLGGSIVFCFDHTVVNVPNLCDFRIGSGIGVQARPTPGIVYVAMDKNQNGKPDEDEWYELAGSEYRSTKVRRNVKIMYERPASFPTMQSPEEVSQYLSWTINDSEKGSIDLSMQMLMWNGMPQWPYWLREGDEGKTLTFEHLVQLPATIEVDDMGMLSPATFYPYGYACNSNPKNVTKSSFDIDWAVDKNGNSVHLPGIDFVKVQTGALQLVGNYGISGTIINSAIDLHLKNIQVTTQAAIEEENK